MSDEGFEEWDADFLDQVIQVEELALSSGDPTQQKLLPTPLPSSHFQQPPPPPHKWAPYGEVSYSPPRELSQRITDSNAKDFDQSSAGTGRSVSTSFPYVRRSQNPKEDEVEKLKRELNRVSKQLGLMEQDCLQLRKERDKKEEQLKSIFSHIEAKDAEFQSKKRKNVESGVHTYDTHGEIQGIQNGNSLNDQVGCQINEVGSACKAIGVQTEKSGECATSSTKSDLLADQHRQNKLLAVWGLPGGQESLRNLVSKLLLACEADFRILFGCLGSSSKARASSVADGKSCGVSLQDHRPPAQSAEAAKISHLYSLFTQIGTGTVRLEGLIEALVDLCSLKNDVVLYRSLRVLRKIINHTFRLDVKSHRRDNIIIEGDVTPNSMTNTCGYKCAETGLVFVNTDDMSDMSLTTYRTRLLNAESLCKDEQSNHGLDWVSVFELMRRIAMTSTDQCVRLEAVFTMNMILMGSNAFLNREKFDGVLVFQSISHLLRKQSGLTVQKQAVRLLFLLLNCPQILAMFCMGLKEEVERAVSANCEARNASALEVFNAILEGLVDCVACDGNGTQELRLRRSTVTLLAFLASSGKPGFEILVGQRLPKSANFLSLILQMLTSEMDVEVVNSSQPPEIFRERTLLIREALILLNRLVSSPQYSTTVLRVITSSRDAASLSVDIANRLSCKGHWLWQSDSGIRQMRECEIVDLARVFKKRVFTYLGDSVL